MSSSPPLPSPPFIPVRGLANLRDAGGYPVTGGAAGRVVRRGVLYRSAAPEGLGLDDGDGVAALRRLGITRVFDLRSVAELAKAGSDGDDDGDGRQGDREKQQQQRLLQLQWEGAERVFAPVFLDKDYSPEALAARFRNYSDGPEVSLSLSLSFSRTHTKHTQNTHSLFPPFSPSLPSPPRDMMLRPPPSALVGADRSLPSGAACAREGFCRQAGRPAVAATRRRGCRAPPQGSS